MRIGSTGANVLSLQNNLKTLGYKLEPDGIFGPNTEKAVMQFQRNHRLVSDGIVGPKTISRLTQLHDPGYLQQHDIEQAAEKLHIPVAAVMAFNEVESRGQGFIDDHKPAILFERHIMRRRLIKAGDFDVEQIQENQPDIVNRRPGGYVGGIREHYRLDRAKQISETAAIESTSWGLFQILGIHWERLGYESAQDFEIKMRTSEDFHLDALVRFIQADSCLLMAIKEQNWQRVARIYNGPGYAKNSYDVKLQTAFNRYCELYGDCKTQTQEVIS